MCSYKHIKNWDAVNDSLQSCNSSRLMGLNNRLTVKVRLGDKAGKLITMKCLLSVVIDHFKTFLQPSPILKVQLPLPVNCSLHQGKSIGVLLRGVFDVELNGSLHLKHLHQTVRHLVGKISHCCCHRPVLKYFFLSRNGLNLQIPDSKLSIFWFCSVDQANRYWWTKNIISIILACSALLR